MTSPKVRSAVFAVAAIGPWTGSAKAAEIELCLKALPSGVGLATVTSPAYRSGISFPVQEPTFDVVTGTDAGAYQAH